MSCRVLSVSSRSGDGTPTLGGGHGCTAPMDPTRNQRSSDSAAAGDRLWNFAAGVDVADIYQLSGIFQWRRINFDVCQERPLICSSAVVSKTAVAWYMDRPARIKTCTHQKQRGWSAACAQDTKRRGVKSSILLALAPHRWLQSKKFFGSTQPPTYRQQPSQRKRCLQQMFVNWLVVRYVNAFIVALAVVRTCRTRATCRTVRSASSLQYLVAWAWAVSMERVSRELVAGTLLYLKVMIWASFSAPACCGHCPRLQVLGEIHMSFFWH
jgi:hypothetical protein